MEKRPFFRRLKNVLKYVHSIIIPKSQFPTAYLERSIQDRLLSLRVDLSGIYFGSDVSTYIVLSGNPNVSCYVGNE